MPIRSALPLAAGLGGVAAVTAGLDLTGVTNTTTVALTYVLVVLFVASLADVVSAIATSLAAMLAFNYFFLPPVGAFTIADPHNWVALIAFLIVSLVASRLSASARVRAQEALDRKDELIEERRGAELARQRAELSSALLASLSHDLRTPLTAIRTAVSNMDSEDLPEDQRRDQARVASEQIDRLTVLFEEILDMARIDAGTVQPQHVWTTPAEIVEAAISQAAAALRGRDVRADARDDMAVEIDPRLAASALAHLLENAAQYGQGGPVDVQGWTDAEGLRLQVRDTGPGLQPHEIERLFEPFYRGELLRRQVPGTGMGLAITRGLVAADGGRVWAENVHPRGASFSIALPARIRPAETAA